MRIIPDRRNKSELPKVNEPPYKQIINAIEWLQKKYSKAAVKYAALRVELSHLQPPVEYETDDGLMNVCKALAEMAGGAMYAGPEKVELDQSADNIISAISQALKEPQQGAS